MSDYTEHGFPRRYTGKPSADELDKCAFDDLLSTIIIIIIIIIVILIYFIFV
jgi:hypothetical protein